MGQAKRVCAEPGCHEITDGTRCLAHRRQAERARGTRQERGYDAVFYRRKAHDRSLIAQGHVLTCWRCGTTVLPHEYSLGHCDDDRTVIHGPEHLACNLAHTRGGCPHISHMT